MVEDRKTLLTNDFFGGVYYDPHTKQREKTYNPFSYLLSLNKVMKFQFKGMYITIHL